jgi:hypothetical protein
MDLNDEQKMLLAALVQRFPDFANAALFENSVTAGFAVVLHWEQDQTSRVYKELKAQGAVQSIGGMDFITRDGAAEGLKALKKSHERDLLDADRKEKAHKRREIRMLVLASIITSAYTLLIVYVTHLMGWNK